jgi:hypothetical protein
LDAPKDLAASITPGLVSRRLVSNTLAIYGIAEIVRCTIEAVVPIALPTTSLVNGIRITNRIMKGKLLNTFTMKLSTSYTILLGFNPSGAVSVRIIAGMNPKITEKSVDQKTI